MAKVIVFISYSRVDTEAAERLKSDLRAVGASIWIDHESLKPGDPDWQNAIRQGIDSATAVVYLGSPEAAESMNVRAEVVIATERNRRIIPLWMRGEQWSRCAPFELIGASFDDARGAAYQTALASLRTSLGLSAVVQPQRSLRAVERATLAGDQIGSRAAWSPDGKYFATWADNHFNIVDASTGRLIRTFAGHSKRVLHVAWSPDSQQIASGGFDETVRVWDVNTGRCLARSNYRKNPIDSIAWSSDGARLAVCGWVSKAEVYDARSLRVLREFEPEFIFASNLDRVAWIKGDEWIATTGANRPLYFWNPSTGAPVGSASRPPNSSGLAELTSAIVSSPDGARFATANGDAVRIWDTSSRSILATLSGHGLWVRSVAWSPDGSRIASAGHDELIRIRDAETFRPLLTITTEHWSEMVAWSADGSQIAASGGDIRVWDIVEDDS